MADAEPAPAPSPDGIPLAVMERIRKRGGSATIYDIAELAGVSPSTVSRALSTPGRISQKTEARIRDAAARLNFRANPMARALNTGRSHTIALVVADITNPVVFGIVRGAEQAASAAGYTLVVAESQESDVAEAETIERLLPSVDGLILATTRLGDDALAAVAARKPMVLINRAVTGVDSILPDVDHGVGQLMTHLSGLGHRSIAYVSGPETSWISGRRWERMLEHAEGLGIALVEIGPVAPTIEGGRDAIRRVRAARVSAVVAFNDLIAIGLMQAAAESGVIGPRDLSVTGFDDIFGSELVVPALTTVRSQLELAGRRAADNVLAHLAADPAAAVDGGLLQTELVIRASTGAASS
jgi:LacI family transcriptional regulator